MSKAAPTAGLRPPSPQPPITAVELLVIGFNALSREEQDQVLSKLQALRLRREAGEKSEMERILASLQRVVEITGCSPETLTSDDYRAAIKSEIEGCGAAEPQGLGGIEPISRVIKHFGSWRLAKEALSLSADNTARQIEARFACRRLGRVHRYSNEILRETLGRCAEEFGHPPTVGEFKSWRQREMELAHAQGQQGFHLPGINTYRRHNKKWPDTLRCFLDGDDRTDDVAASDAVATRAQGES